MAKKSRTKIQKKVISKRNTKKGVSGKYKPSGKQGTRKSLRIQAARERKDMDNLLSAFENIGLKAKNNSPRRKQVASKKKVENPYVKKWKVLEKILNIENQVFLIYKIYLKI